MAIHTITIFATKEKPSPLTIIDDEGHGSHTHEGDKNLTTVCADGDDILFVIDSESEITSIDRIDVAPLKYAGIEYTIFSVLPRPSNDGTKNWFAQLIRFNKNQTGQMTEKYSITYTVDGKQYTEDPKLQIRKN